MLQFMPLATTLCFLDALNESGVCAAWELWSGADLVAGRLVPVAGKSDYWRRDCGSD